MHPEVADPGEVLILHDDSTHVGVTAILTGEGFNVTDGGRYDGYDGADVSAYDLVIFLDGWEYGLDMSSAGQQGLLDFVAAGGVLLVTEWIGFDTAFGRYMELAPALPLEYQGDYCDDGGGLCTETYTAAAVHPIVNGLPTSFTTPPDWSYSFMEANTTTTSSNPRVLLPVRGVERPWASRIAGRATSSNGTWAASTAAMTSGMRIRSRS